jgi:nitrogen fixation/metabolism regulation signal transduction histidine kinase
MKVTSRLVVPRMRVPWWGRLETRVIVALVLLGTLCVGASVYLVRLSVAYFDSRVGDALTQAREVAQSVEPFHQELVIAQISAYEARTRALTYEVGMPADDRVSATRLLRGHSDLVEVELRREPDEVVTVRAPDTLEQALEPGVDAFEMSAPLPDASGTLRVVYRLDPEVDARYQRLGDQIREIGREQRDRGDIEDAVTLVTGVASVLVLLGAVLAGFIVARTTTRKVTQLSRVMTRVGQGDLAARAPPELSGDEVGQLAQAFNHMLDELAAAQQKVAYLQRIGAWQGMARRIAHEIKNPLTPIQLAVQQLRDKDPGTDARFSKLLATSVEIVQDEVEGLRRMVASFSQFAKVPEVRTAPVTLARVLQEFERAYGHLSEDDTETLVVHPPDGEIRLEADRQLLKQALVNLVENAVLSAREHAPAGGVRVEIGTALVEDAVDIYVDDNGPGIDEGRRERVFEPYETSRAQGTGLGLAIVKKVVLDHGGEIWVEGAPLGGARFVLRLPRLHTGPRSRTTTA